MDGVTRSLRGFAVMSKKLLREIASKGGKAAHAKGTAHEFSSEEASKAAQKGHALGRCHVYTTEEARAAGRKGGFARAANRAKKQQELTDALNQSAAKVLEQAKKPVEEAGTTEDRNTQVLSGVDNTAGWSCLRPDYFKQVPGFPPWTRWGRSLWNAFCPGSGFNIWVVTMGMGSLVPVGYSKAAKMRMGTGRSKRGRKRSKPTGCLLLYSTMILILRIKTSIIFVTSNTA
jgi:uncharacterized protein